MSANSVFAESYDIEACSVILSVILLHPIPHADSSSNGWFCLPQTPDSGGPFSRNVPLSSQPRGHCRERVRDKNNITQTELLDTATVMAAVKKGAIKALILHFQGKACEG